jgi:hypothetical protein
MKRKYREYTDDDVIEAATKSKSIAGFLRCLGLRVAGGNYAHAKKTIQRLRVDVSHWTGQGWNKNKQLKNWSDYRAFSRIKPHLIRERGHRCENCKNTHWLGEIIGIELHHIDGDRTNNDKSNLKLLCGNCHHLTPNFRNRKKC